MPRRQKGLMDNGFEFDSPMGGRTLSDKAKENRLTDGDFEPAMGSGTYNDNQNQRSSLHIPISDPRVGVPRMDFGEVTHLDSTDKTQAYGRGYLDEADPSKLVTKLDRNAISREDINNTPLYAYYEASKKGEAQRAALASDPEFMDKLRADAPTPRKMDFGPTWAERNEAYKEKMGNINVTEMDAKDKTNRYNDIEDDLAL